MADPESQEGRQQNTKSMQAALVAIFSRTIFFTRVEKTVWLSCYNELLIYSYRRPTATVRNRMEIFFVTQEADSGTMACNGSFISESL